MDNPLKRANLYSFHHGTHHLTGVKQIIEIAVYKKQITVRLHNRARLCVYSDVR